MNSVLLDSVYEYGLRALIVLQHEFPEAMSCERIMYYDYYATYNIDIVPKQNAVLVFPPYPYRATEFYNKRKRMQDGLRYYAAKDLITIAFNEEGIRYCANVNSKWMYDSLQGNSFVQKYVSALHECAQMLKKKSDQEILIGYSNNASLSHEESVFHYYERGET